MSRLARACALLFFSGACALIYQVAWFRELRLIFGASTAASSAVLAIFMGGLGIGGAILGKRADKSANPLRLYAHLELFVSVASAATPLLVYLADAIYIGAGGTETLGTVGATALRIVLSVLVLGPSTVAMGGTLPAMARAVERAADLGRQRVAALYGVNTMGAVAGAVVSNFLLLEVLGTQMTLWVAALVNALVGITARAMSRSFFDEETAHAATEAAVDAPPAEEPSRGVAWFPPLAAAISGASFMLMELVWYRMLGPLLGGTSYTFGLILAVALAGIGVGGALYSRSRVLPSPRAFALTCALEAVAIALPFALGDRLAELALLLRPLAASGFSSAVVAWTIIAALVVFPAAVVSGAQFPLVIGLYGRGANAVGKDVGNAYAANTLGAIVGAIAGGFGLLPALTAPTCWKLVVVLLVATSVLAIVVDARIERLVTFRAGAAWSSIGLAAASVLFVTARGPTSAWRHSGIGAGRADQFASRPGGFEDLLRNAQRTIAWEADGLESSVALESATGYSFIVNGKADGHALIDSPTQVMSGVLGALLHPSAKRALVVGLGTGSTAGWLGSIPAMERVDVVELEPAILRVASDCKHVNQDVMRNPKVVIALGDAREALRATRRKYDIIFSEPSNPYRAGISSMYTVEYYRAARGRLEQGGLFIQWMQGYEVDERAVTTVITTLKSIFERVSIWQTTRGDILFLAQTNDAPIDVEMMRKRLDEEPYRSAARSVWKTATAEGILAHHLANDDFTSLVVQKKVAGINTDDQNLLEFAFARSLGSHGLLDVGLFEVSRRLGHDAPRVNGAISPERTVEERWLYQSWDKQPFQPPVAATSGATRSFGMVLDLLRGSRQKEGLRAWRKLERGTVTAYEALSIARAAAMLGDSSAPDLIRLVENESEKAFLEALYFRASAPTDRVRAAEALERGFLAYRDNPWVAIEVAGGALDHSVMLGAEDKSLAQRFYDLLAVPFAAEAQRVPRLTARARIGAYIDPKACVAALDALSPPTRSLPDLRLRAGCYTAASDPRLPQIEEDLATLWSEKAPFGTFLPGGLYALEKPERPLGAPTDAGAPAPDAAMPDAQ